MLLADVIETFVKTCNREDGTIPFYLVSSIEYACEAVSKNTTVVIENIALSLSLSLSLFLLSLFTLFCFVFCFPI